MLLSADSAITRQPDTEISSFLLFDKAGNLWGTDVISFFRLDSDQMQAGAPEPALVRNLSLPEGIALDAAGNI